MAVSTIFHTRSHDNALRKMNGGIKLIALLLLSVFLTTGNTAFVLLLSLLLLMTAVVIKLPLSSYFKDGFFFVIIALFIYISEYSATGTHIQATLAAIKFLSVLLASLLLMDTTTPDEIARGVGTMLHPILGKYAYHLASLVELTIAMIPRIFSVSSTIIEARKARGEHFLKHPFKSLIGISTSILSALLESISAYADALESRFYNSQQKRYTPPLNIYDLAMILFLVGITGGFICSKLI